MSLLCRIIKYHFAKLAAIKYHTNSLLCGQIGRQLSYNPALRFNEQLRKVQGRTLVQNRTAASLFYAAKLAACQLSYNYNPALRFNELFKLPPQLHNLH